jgi:hypothetical protein
MAGGGLCRTDLLVIVVVVASLGWSTELVVPAVSTQHNHERGPRAAISPTCSARIHVACFGSATAAARPSPPPHTPSGYLANWHWKTNSSATSN